MESVSEPSSMSFQKIVLIVAIIILILTLSIIGYMMYYTAQSQPYPPTGTQCPDTWVGSTAGACTTTTSGSNIGNFIMTDKYCSIGASNNECNNGSSINYMRVASDCSGNWVQGNMANNLDSSNCYLLAKGWAGSSNVELTHQLSTLDKDIKWAQQYDIAWDGYN